MPATEAKAKTRAQALRSYHVTDFPALTGREEEWRFTPLKRLRGLATADGGTPTGAELKYEYDQLPAGVTVSTVDRTDRASGALVPFDDPAAFATTVGDLLADPGRLASARASARRLGAELSWPAVGGRFAEVFSDAFSDAAPPVAGPARVRSAGRVRPARLHARVGELRVAWTPTAGGEPAWSHNRQPPASASPAP